MIKQAGIIPLLIAGCFLSCGRGKNVENGHDINLNDTTKVRLYERKSIFYQDKAPDSAINFARQGLLLAQSLHDLQGEGLMLNRFARINEKYDNLSLATKYQQEALSVFKELRNRSAAADATTRLGLLQTKLKKFPEGKALLQQGLSSHQENRDTDGIIQAYTRFGEASVLSGDTDQALKHYALAQKFHQSGPLSPEYLSLLHTIGQLYVAKGDYSKALEYFKEGINKSLTLKFKQANLAFIRNAGNMSDSLGNNKDALSYHLDGLQKARKWKLPEEEARSLVGLAGVFKERDADQSIEHLKNALNIAHTIGNKQLISEIYRSLSSLYRQQARYKEAIQTLEEHYRLVDNLENVEKGHKLAAVQHSYDLAESKLRIESLQLLNEQRTYERNAGILAVVAVLIILLILVFYYRKTRLLNKRLHESNLIKDKLFSIIGHDLRNPIGGITQLLAMMEEGNLSTEEHHALISEMRKQGDVTLEILNALLNWGETQLKGVHVKPSTFNPAVIIGKNIAALNKQVADKSIVINDHVSPELTVYGDANHFDFVLRNLLSNAIKFSPTSGTIEIAANTKTDPEMVIFSVRDQGKGISRKQQDLFHTADLEISYGTNGEKGTGIGLMLSKEFIKANQGHIWIQSEEGKGAAFYFSFKKSQD